MSSKIGAKEKKTLAIIIAVVVVMILAIVGSVTMFMKSDKGQEVSNNAGAQFNAVTVPEDSSQLTAVKDAPVGRQDKDDDPNQNVDLLGNPVNHSDLPGRGDSSPSPHNDNKSKNKRDKNTHRRGSTPAQTNKKPSAKDMKQISNTGKRVKIPSLNADFALGSLVEPKNGTVEPTNFTSVFWIKNRGVKYTQPEKGSVFLAAHALDTTPDGRALSGLAPGNWLYDPVTRESKLNPGDILEVGGTKYKFKEFKRAGKGLIARDKDIWNEKKPNRLVFLTCISNSNDNGVFIFEKA